MEQKGRPDTNVAKILGVEHSKGRGKRWVGWFLLVLLIASGLISGFAVKNRAATPSTQFKTQEAKRGDLVVTVTATGNLEPTNQVDAGSELSGTVRSVTVDYNDRVKVNQVLARLDTTKLEAQSQKYKAELASAKAKVLQAQATVREAKSKLARYKQVRELSGNKVPSQYELEAAEAALDRASADEAVAQAVVTQARATLEANETDLAKSVIRSPINGVVLIRNVEPGQTVAASLQAPVLFTLAEDLAQMELHVDVDEADVGLVKEGQKAVFTVDAYPERTFKARITQVRFGSESTDNVVTYETVLKVDNTDLSLRPGMTATADITVKKKEGVILIPNAALRFKPLESKRQSSRRGILGALLPGPPRRREQNTGGSSGNQNQQRVWTLRDGRLVPVRITTGASDGSLTEITEGQVRPGMRLVVSMLSKKK